jgi:hypothetical protein
MPCDNPQHSREEHDESGIRYRVYWCECRHTNVYEKMHEGGGVNMYCHLCHLVIAPFAPKNKDGDKTFHANCWIKQSRPLK